MTAHHEGHKMSFRERQWSIAGNKPGLGLSEEVGVGGEEVEDSRPLRENEWGEGCRDIATLAALTLDSVTHSDSREFKSEIVKFNEKLDCMCACCMFARNPVSRGWWRVCDRMGRWVADCTRARWTSEGFTGRSEGTADFS